MMMSFEQLPFLKCPLCPPPDRTKLTIFNENIIVLVKIVKCIRRQTHSSLSFKRDMLRKMTLLGYNQPFLFHASIMLE